MGQETLGNQNGSEVLSIVGSLLNAICNSVDNVLERLTSEVALLRDDDHVGVCSQGALESQVRRIFAHKSDEVPVLDGGG